MIEGVAVADDVMFENGVEVLPALGESDIGPAQHTTDHRVEQRDQSPSCPNARRLFPVDYEPRRWTKHKLQKETDTSQIIRNLTSSSSRKGQRAPPHRACNERARGSSDLIQYITDRRSAHNYSRVIAHWLVDVEPASTS